MTSHRVESIHTGGLYVRLRTQKNQNCVPSDTDKPAVVRGLKGRRNGQSSSPSTRYATSSGGKKHERSRSPSRTACRERVPVDAKPPSQRWRQDSGLSSPILLPQHIIKAKDLEADCPTMMLPTDPPSPGQEDHNEEENKGEPSSSFKLIEQLVQGVAARATLLPCWEEEQSKVMLECTKRELWEQTSTNETVQFWSNVQRHILQDIPGSKPLPTLGLLVQQEPEVATLLAPLASFHINIDSSNDMVQEEVATLLTPLESLHICPESSDTGSDSSGVFSSVEDDDSDILLDSAPDFTLKPAVWDEQEVGADYMDEDEEEGDEQIPYTLPSYESVYVSLPCSSQVHIGAYQAEDMLSRYHYIGRPRKVVTSRGKRFVPYTLGASPPIPETPSKVYATDVPKTSPAKVTVGSILLARIRELADGPGYEPRSQAGMQSSSEQALPRERKDKWSPFTHRKGVNDITGKFGRLVLRT